MSLTPIVSIPSILSLLLLGGCVATDPDSLGTLDSGNDGPGTSDGGTESAGTSASAGSEGSTSETGEPAACPDPALAFNEPPCNPNGALPALPASGCYQPCEGPGAACAVGTCSHVEVDPCPCAEGLDCCEACGAVEAWLCVEGLPDAVCEAIVGTTFASIEELECGLGPTGPVPCHWQIVFEEDGDYLWNYSDVGEGGTYTCADGVIDTGIDHDIAYDATTGILTWDAVEYVAAPA